MRRNVAGQAVGCQMVDASTGAAFTGAVSVLVTLDAGTQAAGTVGGGACTHEGNGYHTYLPAQAETDGDLAAFTFIATGAIPRTVQIYTAPADYLADVRAEMDNALVSYGAVQPTVPGRLLNVSPGGSVTVGLLDTGSILPGSFDPTTFNAISDDILTRDWTLVTGAAARSLLNAGRFLRNRWIVSLGVLTVYEEDDTTVAWTGSTVGTAGADPITSVDPA